MYSLTKNLMYSVLVIVLTFSTRFQCCVLNIDYAMITFEKVILYKFSSAIVQRSNLVFSGLTVPMKNPKH